MVIKVNTLIVSLKGFLSTGDRNLPGNYGMLDQIEVFFISSIFIYQTFSLTKNNIVNFLVFEMGQKPYF